MSKLTYVFKNSVDFTSSMDIELIDCEYVNVWKDTLIQVCTDLNFNWGWIRHNRPALREDMDPSCDRFKGYIKPKMDTLIEEMIVAYEHLSTTQPDVRSVLNVTLNGLRNLSKDVTKLTQHHLNECHRHFTSLGSLPIGNPRHMTNADEDQRKDYFYIQEINRIVHCLETFTMYKLERHLKFPDPYYSISFTNANDNAYFKKDDCPKVWNYVKLIEPGCFDLFTENYDYDVWLHEDIFGKDLKRAWIDEDDLTKDDITGNLLLTPSIMVDVNKLCKRVFDDESFRKELKESGKTVDRLPLGNITSIPDKFFFENMSDNKQYDRNSCIDKIILDGETIYSLSDKQHERKLFPDNPYSPDNT